MTDFAPTAIGFAAGLLVGATSTGGGALLTPALILFARVPPSVAIGSDVLIASGMKLFGGGFYAFRREVHWPTVGRLAAGSIPGALAGMAILNRLPVDRIETWLTHALGFVLVAAGAALLLRVTLAGRLRLRRTPAAAVTIGLGFVTGVLVSMTSIGSGSLLLCMLALAYPLGARETVGTDLVHALVLSVVATLGHANAGARRRRPGRGGTRRRRTGCIDRSAARYRRAGTVATGRAGRRARGDRRSVGDFRDVTGARARPRKGDAS